ncbi:MAG: arsenite methyltransferase [Armatimonadetes bacterium]|nr:arsenite methyltransferase [Armatimonadota bacterium]
MGAEPVGTDAVAVRAAVAAAYGKRVSSQRGCCGGGRQKNVSEIAPQVLGYTDEDVQAVPAGAEAPTFGCGNPLAFGEVRAGETVVDLGSGAGFDLLIAAERVGPSGRVIGVDMTDEMIERARANIAAAGHANVEVRKGLIEDLPVESGTVDWVISNCVINLSPEKPRVFAEMARVLKPGGRMLVADIVADDLPAGVRHSLAAYSACVGGALSEEQYVAGLTEAGLADVEIRRRTTYTCAELAEFAEASGLVSAADDQADSEVVRRLAAELGGKVASIAVFARKPELPG